MAKPTPATRRGTYERDGHACCSCGATSPLSYQHRAGDGAGGSKRLPGPADGLTACAVCNARFEADLQGKALRLGWKIPRWVRDRGLAARVPYFHNSTGRWYRLDPERFVRHPISIREAARMLLEVYGPDGPKGGHAWSGSA